jgi:hypothetical protein
MSDEPIQPDLQPEPDEKPDEKQARPAPQRGSLPEIKPFEAAPARSAPPAKASQPSGGLPEIVLPFDPRRAALIALAALVCLVGVVGVVVLIATGALGGGYKQLTADKPLEHPDGLRLTLRGDSPLRVKLGSIPRQDFLDGKSDQEWRDALAALPPYLDPKSPVFTINVKGEAAGGLLTEVIIPADAQPIETLSLYTWDAEAGKWRFVPGHAGPAGDVVQTDEVVDNIALFQTAAPTPLIGTLLEADHVLDAQNSSALNLLIPTGLHVMPDGALDGALAGGFQAGSGYAIVPLVQADAATLGTLLADETSRAAHAAGLALFVVNDGYDGIALDYTLPDGGREAFVDFVEALASALDEHGKMLVVLLPRPTGAGMEWNTGPYDWRALGAAADVVIVSPGDDPAAYAPGGAASELLTWAVGEVSRFKLRMAISSLSVRKTGDQIELISLDEALDPLGKAETAKGTQSVLPGQKIEFALQGEAQDVTLDPTSGLYLYSLPSEGDQPSQVWLVTAAALRQRTELAAQYHLGGLIVRDMLAPGNDPGLSNIITAYKAGIAPPTDGQLSVAWTISKGDKVVLEQTTDLTTPLEWVVPSGASGTYTASAEVRLGGLTDKRGSVEVQVSGAAVAEVEEEEVQPQAAPAPSEPSEPPVAAAGATGGFELGGQTVAFTHIADMQSARMTWAKFQLEYPNDPGFAAGAIQTAHANGFKILISVPALQKYPSSIDFGAVVNYFRSVAALGPDAIEVWNEQNIDREWPAGQIDPNSYVTNMLAPSFNAIKGVNPNVMVISGALAPTGYFGGGCSAQGCDDAPYLRGMAAAGAVNYMDCIGVHYNEGIISPTQSSGDPRDNFYSRYYSGMVNVYSGAFGGGRPLCFTELGYLSPEGLGTLPDTFAWAQNTTVAQQAQWLSEAASMARSSGAVRLMIVFNVDYTGWGGGDPQAGYAIVRPDGSCPACASLGALP